MHTPAPGRKSLDQLRPTRPGTPGQPRHRTPPGSRKPGDQPARRTGTRRQPTTHLHHHKPRRSTPAQPGQRAHPGSPNPNSLWITREIPGGPEQLGSHRLKPQSGAALCSRRPGSGPTAAGKDKPAALTPAPSTLFSPTGHMGPGGASRRGRGPGAAPWESTTEPIRSEGITM